MEWMCQEGFSAAEWGWAISDGQLCPVTTESLPAPESLLKIIHCNCSTGCSNMRCGCRKNGLKCTNLCGNCWTTECSNTSIPINDDQTTDESDSE